MPINIEGKEGEFLLGRAGLLSPAPQVKMMPNAVSRQTNPLPFLPTCREDMSALGIDELDILLISGDAYIDHPSFGVALLGRLLQAEGYNVGIVAQPRWEDPKAAEEDIACMGRPRLFTGISAGAVDSILAHYTAFRKKRSDDAYTPGGRAGRRPNRACTVYTGLVRRIFPAMPVILGGIEASLRRVSHYDFWSDSLKRPLLLDAKADLLIYGMAEYTLKAVAKQAALLYECEGQVDRKRLAEVCQIIPGLVFAASSLPHSLPFDLQTLPAYEEINRDKSLLMQATLELEKQVHAAAYGLVQYSADRAIIVTPPAPLPTQEEMDAIYALPFTRLPHPSYQEPVPAWEMIRTAITSHRGCGGGCSFCSLALHQGRRMSSRSQASIVQEAKLIAKGPNGWFVAVNGADQNIKASGQGKLSVPRWAGAISDVGGPSADMWQTVCTLPEGKKCARVSCLHPKICRFFRTAHDKAVSLLREVAGAPGVHHVRVASGVRFDLLLSEPEALKAYTMEFTGGQLKIAPEHTEAEVLALMRKPDNDTFTQFLSAFNAASRKAGKEQYTIPYLISAFPGCTEAHMRSLAVFLAARNWKPQQVQCFIPTPGTVATAMFYAGIDPSGKALYVARTDAERMRQHYLLMGDSVVKRNPKNFSTSRSSRSSKTPRKSYRS